MSYSATHRRSIYLKTIDGKWLDHVRVRQLLNLPAKLPRDFTLDDTVIATSIGPITAFVVAGKPIEYRAMYRGKRIVKRSFHRVMSHCPHAGCNRVIPIGQLHQHLPIHDEFEQSYNKKATTMTINNASRFEVWRSTFPDYQDHAARSRICKATTIEHATEYMERDADMHLGYCVMVIDTLDDQWITSVVKHPVDGIGCAIGCVCSIQQAATLS